MPGKNERKREKKEKEGEEDRQVKNNGTPEAWVARQKVSSEEHRITPGQSVLISTSSIHKVDLKKNHCCSMFNGPTNANGKAVKRDVTEQNKLQKIHIFYHLCLSEEISSIACQTGFVFCFLNEDNKQRQHLIF